MNQRWPICYCPYWDSFNSYRDCGDLDPDYPIQTFSHPYIPYIYTCKYDSLQEPSKDFVPVLRPPNPRAEVAARRPACSGSPRPTPGACRRRCSALAQGAVGFVTGWVIFKCRTCMCNIDRSLAHIYIYTHTCNKYIYIHVLFLSICLYTHMYVCTYIYIYILYI